MTEFYTVITNAGRELVAQATQAGEKVDITHFAVGDGGGVPVTPNESQIQLVNECWRGLVSTYKQEGTNIIIDTYIPSDEESFTAREMGIFTADGTLFAVSNIPDMRKVLPSEGAVGDFTFGMKIDVSNLDTSYIEIHTDPKLDFVKTSEKGQPNGVLPLNDKGKADAEYLPPLSQIEVTVTTDAGATVTVTLGETVLAKTAEDGSAKFNLPSYGEWTFKAELDGDSSGEVLLNVNTVKQYELNLILPKIYGVSYDGTSTTRLSRTDKAALFIDPVAAVSNGAGSSPFDSIYPWSDIKRITDSAAGELVEIPKFYYKWSKSGKIMTLQITDRQLEGFKISPAHADRADGKGERDKVYVGRYHCTSNYKSLTNQAQKTDITRSAARSGISSLGSGIYQWDFAMWHTIHMLYLVEFADWNSQTCIGYGCSTSGSKENNGKTDSMQYHTGTTAANRTTYGYTQYRYIEGLWDNVYDWLDGCYYNSSGLNVIKNPNQFSDTTNGVLVGLPVGGYPTEFAIPEQEGFDWAIYPSKAGGSGNIYCPDYWNFSGGSPCLYVGGNCGQSTYHGLFYVYYNGVSYSDSYIGSRLQKLP